MEFCNYWFPGQYHSEMGDRPKKWRNKIIHKHESGTLSFFPARPFIWIIKESKHDNHLNSALVPDIIQCDLQTRRRWGGSLCGASRLNFLSHPSLAPLRRPRTRSVGFSSVPPLSKLNLSALVLKSVLHWLKNKQTIKVVQEVHEVVSPWVWV